MKRILTLILVLVLAVSIFASCDTVNKILGKDQVEENPQVNDETPETPDNTDKNTPKVEDALSYVHLMYQDFKPTISDYELIGQVDIGGVKFTVTWTSDNEKVNVRPSTKSGMWVIDLPETNDGEFSYTLTATVADVDGNSKTKDFKFTMPALIAISIPEALAAEDGTEVVVKGTVSKIGTPWSEGYKNISVTIKDEQGNELYLYRLGTNVELGDVIIVSGTMATYNGSRQIAQGGTAIIVGHNDVTINYQEMTIPQVNSAADGIAVKVTGTVYEIKTAWSDDYGNISVYIKDSNGNSLYVYRLSTKVEIGDVIVIQGYVGSYNGSKQIAEGSKATITGHVDIEGGEDIPDTPVNPNPSTNLEIVTAPVVGVAYKFGFLQGNLNEQMYFKGTINAESTPWYLATSTNTAEAVDVYLETVDGVEGAYRLYFMDGDTKTYIVAYPRDNDTTKGTLKLDTATPDTYYTFDSANNTLVYTSVTGEQFYLGTYSNFKTVSCSAWSNLATSFPAHLYAAGEGNDNGGSDTHEHNFVDGKCECGETDPNYTPSVDPTYTAPVADQAYDLYMVLPSGTVYFSGSLDAEKGTYLATTTDASASVKIYFEVVSGGYNIYFMNGDTKTYINAEGYLKSNGYAGCHFVLGATPTCVWTYNTEYGILEVYAEAEGKSDTFFAGTYGTYNTVSLSGVYYRDQITSGTQFPARIVLAGGEVTPPSGGDTPVDPKPETPTDGFVSISDALASAEGTQVKFTGTVQSFYEDWSSYNNCSPYIVDEYGNKILVFRTTTHVYVGDVVTVEGTITIYNTVAQIAQGSSTVTVTTIHTCSFSEATCTDGSACTSCGKAGSTAALGHTAANAEGKCDRCGIDLNASYVEKELSFSSTANRTVFTTSQQVWAANGVTLTNDKGSSTSNVADYSNPARFYKSSKLTLECANMTKIEFVCNSSSYATALQSSIATSSNYTVSVSGSTVTITFTEATNTFVIDTLSGGQVRMNSLTVTAIG